MTARRRSRRPASGPPVPPDAEAALEIAARFLATRPRTRWELRRRLRRANVMDEQILVTLDRLVEMGHVDDEAFARWWMEQRDRHAPRGRRLVEAELRQHGVPAEVIAATRDPAGDEAAVASPSAPEDALPESEVERARLTLARHLRGRPIPEESRAVQRLGTFLLRRGFDPETARTVLREAGRSDLPDE